MSDFPHSAVDEYKTQASLLLKQLRSDDLQSALQAVLRFQVLPHLTQTPAIEIVKSKRIKLKHALSVIALENDFDTWSEFKHHLEKQERFTAYKQAKFQTLYTPLYPPRCYGFILEWHADYEQASQELGQSGGYLLPYQNQYFICQREYIAELGLDPDDPDWALIGWNWVKPADNDAWERLNNQLPQPTQ